MEHLCAGEKLASCLEAKGDTEGCGGGDHRQGQKKVPRSRVVQLVSAASEAGLGQ